MGVSHYIIRNQQTVGSALRESGVGKQDVRRPRRPDHAAIDPDTSTSVHDVTIVEDAAGICTREIDIFPIARSRDCLIGCENDMILRRAPSDESALHKQIFVGFELE